MCRRHGTQQHDRVRRQVDSLLEAGLSSAGGNKQGMRASRPGSPGPPL